jgi:hypothetical protein
MVVGQVVAETAGETQTPVDFYAGIAALCVVILFAKFNTHAARGKKLPEDGLEKANNGDGHGNSLTESEGWFRAHASCLHLACVFFAYLAIAVSLYVLGWADASDSYESILRPGVAVSAAIASLVLALDLYDQR